MKIALIVIGVIVAFMGAACIAGGSLVLVALDSDGFLSSGDGTLESENHALVSENAEFEEIPDPPGSLFDDWGTITLRLRVEATDPAREVFIGVGPARDVEAWLAGTAWDEIDDIDFDPLRVDLDPQAGEGPPGPPADQDFWHAQVRGTGEQELEWDIESGDYRFVIMNADASAGVAVTGNFAVKAPAAMPVSIAMIVLGVVALIFGIVAVVLAARAIGRSSPPPTTTPATDGPAPVSPPPPAAPLDTPPPPPSRESPEPPGDSPPLTENQPREGT